MQHFDAGGYVEGGGELTPGQEPYLQAQNDSPKNRLLAADLNSARKLEAAQLAYESARRPPEERDTVPTPAQDSSTAEVQNLNLPVSVGYGPPPSAPMAPAQAETAQPPPATEAPATAAAPQGAQLPAAPALRIPSGPNTGKDLAAAEGDAEAAQLQQAKTAQSLAATQMQAQQAALDEQARVAKQWNSRWQESQSRAEALANQIANGQVDPNHLWGSMNTGQMLGTSFAMILSGIGSGMTMGRQQNMAVDFVQKAIDRDIEAQKINLDTKKSLLSHYVQQGHDIQEAGRLARADALDAAAGQLRMVGTKYAGQQAADAAQANIAVLHRQAALERQQVYAQGMDNQLKALQVMQAKQALQMAPLQREIAMKSEMGAVFPKEAAYLMDEKRRVVGKNGVTYATSPESKKEIEELRQAYSSGMSAIDRYEKLGGSLGLGGSTSDEGLAAQQDALNAYQAILGRSNAPRGEQEKNLEKAFPNPTSPKITKEGVRDLAKRYRQIMASHMAAANASRLQGGSAAAAQLGGL